jgi:hypothetical protein
VYAVIQTSSKFAFWLKQASTTPLKTGNGSPFLPPLGKDLPLSVD